MVMNIRFSSAFTVAIFVPVALCSILIGCTLTVSAFKLTNLVPNNYRERQQVPVKVNSLTSLTNVVPLPWYSLPWCQIRKDRMTEFPSKNKNIGEILRGDENKPSLFVFEMMDNMTCRDLCDPIQMDKRERDLLTKRIEQNYRGHLIMDNLPVGEENIYSSRFTKVLSIGFPLGLPTRRSKLGRTVVFNHLQFSVFYREGTGTMLDGDDDTYIIVGFLVTPFSVNYFGENSPICNDKFSFVGVHPAFTTDESIRYTYSVQWHLTDEEWSTRWDIYMKSSPIENRVHWFSIINAVIVVIVLSAVIGFILLRALRRDIARYNDPEAIQDERDESGWKQVHGDVFRKPESAGLLTVMVGSGLQLVGMFMSTMFFAMLGFLAPANRGAFLTALILMYILLGSVNGFATAQLAKFFKMRSWKIIFIAGVFFPAQMFLGYFFLNFVNWGLGATTATPIGSMFTLLALWIFISLPLVLIGGGLGYRQDDIKIPVKVSSIPRTIPPLPWFLRFPMSAIIPGFLPFGAAFVEAVFILGSVWQGRLYHVFGVLSVVFAVVLMTAAEATIVVIYTQLVHLEYRWWWSAFISAGSYGIWLFSYSILHFMISLSIRSWWASVLYFGYMFLASYLCFMMIGSFGFVVTFWFIRSIYGAVKVD